METGREGPDLPYKAKTAVSQWHIVKPDTDGRQVSHATAAGAKAIGIAVRPATAGSPVEVRVYGACMVRLSASAALGDLLIPAAGGKAKPSSADGDRIVAVALEAGAADDVVRCIVTQSIKG